MDIKEIHEETVPDAKLTKSGYDEEPASKRRKRARINFTRPQVYVVYERMWYANVFFVLILVFS